MLAQQSDPSNYSNIVILDVISAHKVFKTDSADVSGSRSDVCLMETSCDSHLLSLPYVEPQAP